MKTTGLRIADRGLRRTVPAARAVPQCCVRASRPIQPERTERNPQSAIRDPSSSIRNPILVRNPNP
jgi:hypothetical protein